MSCKSFFYFINIFYLVIFRPKRLFKLRLINFLFIEIFFNSWKCQSFLLKISDTSKSMVNGRLWSLLRIIVWCKIIHNSSYFFYFFLFLFELLFFLVMREIRIHNVSEFWVISSELLYIFSCFYSWILKKSIFLCLWLKKCNLLLSW